MDTQTPTHQVLARKWRPGRFEDLVGQPHVVRALANALESGRLHHAYLFSGTRGVGKTTIARILARCLNCERGVSSSPCGSCRSCVEIAEGRHLDLIEVDAASRTGIDDTRELMDNAAYAPVSGRFKVYLIDEVHMLSEKSFNALLKTLEEPPGHVKFLLATTDPQKLPVTVLSRCLQFNLKAVAPSVISDHLANILAQEGITSEPGALLRLAEAADGSLRDALSLADQAIAFGGAHLTEVEVSAMVGLLPRSHLEELLEAIWQRDGTRMLQILDALEALAPDWDRVLDTLAAIVHEIAVLQVLAADSRPAKTARLDLASSWQRDVAAREAPEELQLTYDILTRGREGLAAAPSPRVGAEMTLIRVLAFRPAIDPEPVAKGKGTSAAAEVPATAAPSRTTAASSPTTVSSPITAAPSRTNVAPSPAPASSPETAAPSPVSVASPPPSGSAAADHFDWHDFAVGLPAGPAKELALNCTVVDRQEGRIVLAVAKAHRMLATGRVESQLGDALARAMGAPVRVELQTQGKNVQDSPAARLASVEQRARANAEQDLLADPGLRALQAESGARIEAVSVEPAQSPGGSAGRASSKRSG